MTAVDEVIGLELRLLERETRRRPEEVERLLHPEFREFGESGTVWDRESIVAALAADPGGGFTASDVRATEVAGGVVLVTYATGASLRSSLWVRSDDGWRVLFHQGTRRLGD